MKQVDWIRFDAAATHFCFELSTICTHSSCFYRTKAAPLGTFPNTSTTAAHPTPETGVLLVEMAMVSPPPAVA
jgi:hypothetical protein